MKENNLSENKQKGFFIVSRVFLFLLAILFLLIILNQIINYYSKQQVAKNLKENYIMLSKVVLQSQKVNGPVNTWNWGNPKAAGSVRNSFKTYWAPYLKDIKYCNSFKECGYKDRSFFLLANRKNFMPPVMKNLRTTVILPNGSALIVSGFIGSYNRTQKEVYIDLNGSKEPNRLGVDLFDFVLDPKKGLLPIGYNEKDAVIKDSCLKNLTPKFCAAKVIRNGWKIPKDYSWDNFYWLKSI